MTKQLDMAVCQNLVPLVNIKIAGKWMFIPLKMVLIGIDPYPYSLIAALRRAKSGLLETVERHRLDHYCLWIYHCVPRLDHP
jgi:hypothetical protein